MMDDKYALFTVAVIGSLLTLTILGGCHEVEQTTREAIKAGLVQKTQKGTSVLVWSKP